MKKIVSLIIVLVVIVIAVEAKGQEKYPESYLEIAGPYLELYSVTGLVNLGPDGTGRTVVATVYFNKNLETEAAEIRSNIDNSPLMFFIIKNGKLEVAWECCEENEESSPAR